MGSKPSFVLSHNLSQEFEHAIVSSDTLWIDAFCDSNAVPELERGLLEQTGQRWVYVRPLSFAVCYNPAAADILLLHGFAEVMISNQIGYEESEFLDVDEHIDTVIYERKEHVCMFFQQLRNDKLLPKDIWNIVCCYLTSHF